MTMAVKMRKVRRSSPGKRKRTKGNAKTGVVKENSTADVDEKAKTGRIDLSQVRNKTCCTADSNFVHAHLCKEGNNQSPSAERATCGLFLTHFLTIFYVLLVTTEVILPLHWKLTWKTKYNEVTLEKWPGDRYIQGDRCTEVSFELP